MQKCYKIFPSLLNEHFISILHNLNVIKIINTKKKRIFIMHEKKKMHIKILKFSRRRRRGHISINLTVNFLFIIYKVYNNNPYRLMISIILESSLKILVYINNCC
jgi:hypothetical protein